MSYALVFPGQGSQSTGMINCLLESHRSIVENTFTEAADAISINLLELVQNGPETEINKTAITQPLMLTTSIAIYRVWQSYVSKTPAVLAGHSLGEYSALVVANSLDFTDAVKMVHLRGNLMQQAVPIGVGGVAAILGLDNEQVINICQQVSDEKIVETVNFNAPGQVVIAGHIEKVNEAIKKVKEAGAKRAILLPLSVPVHCQLLKPAAEKLNQMFNQFNFRKTTIDTIHNVDGKIRNTVEELQIALIEQLYSSVKWIDCIHSIEQYSVKHMIECGPGKVLFGLNRRIAKAIEHFFMFDEESIVTTSNKI